MDVPEDLQYTNDHEWAKVDAAANRVTMGITAYAQDALGDIVFVQLPTIGTKVQAGLSFSEVESTKSVSDIYAPITGTVIDINRDLEESPQKLNEDPYGTGWLCVIEPVSDASYDHFIDAPAYRSLVEH